jgi:hypothetical protein
LGPSCRFQYPWLDDQAVDALRNGYLPADYRADAAGVEVEGRVRIQAEIDHQLDPVGMAAWVATLAKEKAAARRPGPVACVAYADLRAADVREVRHISMVGTNFPVERLAGAFGSLYELVVGSRLAPRACGRQPARAVRPVARCGSRRDCTTLLPDTDLTPPKAAMSLRHTRNGAD